MDDTQRNRIAEVARAAKRRRGAIAMAAGDFVSLVTASRLSIPGCDKAAKELSCHFGVVHPKADDVLALFGALPSIPIPEPVLPEPPALHIAETEDASGEAGEEFDYR